MKSSQDIIDKVIRLYEAGKIISILNSSDELLTKFPNNATIHNILGAGFSQFNDFEKGIYHLQKAIQLEPQNYLILNNLGNVLLDVNEYQKTIEVINKALNIRPDFAEGYNTLGLALYKGGDIEGSIFNFKKAIELKNDLFSAYNNIGISYKQKKDIYSAFNCFVEAIKINPDFIEPKHNLAAIINEVKFEKDRTDLYPIIYRILDTNNCVDPNDISNSIFNLLKLDPYLGNIFDNYFSIKDNYSLDELISNFENCPLFLKTISISLVCNLEIERILQNLRSSILFSISQLQKSNNLLKFQSALALHCFTNEYIYSESLEEEKALVLLENEIDNQFSIGKQPKPQLILCIASYRPLNKYNWCSQIINQSNLNEVIKRQILEPNLEKKIELCINNSKIITDKTSKKVKQQYEENPYPRWISSHLRLFPLSMAELIAESNLKVNNLSINKINEPKVLIAGCGTGQQSLYAASLYKNSKILAIDLSISSLKYAKRKTEELGIENIEYIQHDILDLKNLKRKFDIIECVGVLHHMSDPFLGWSILADCLNDGGLMNIGLYSKQARVQISKLRNSILSKKVENNNTVIKSYRASLSTSISEQNKWITSIQDFYSTSMFRDLLFHVQEEQFSIKEIKKMISDLGLVFSGFEDLRIVDLFKDENKSSDDLYDLDKWHLFEAKNLKLFKGMYQFWCQKN